MWGCLGKGRCLGVGVRVRCSSGVRGGAGGGRGSLPSLCSGIATFPEAHSRQPRKASLSGSFSGQPSLFFTQFSFSTQFLDLIRFHAATLPSLCESVFSIQLLGLYICWIFSLTMN